MGAEEIEPLVESSESASRRLVSLQCLRGIAALMVVVHHVLHQSSGFLSVWPTEAWQAGVDLFFVISGFVMVYVTSQRERSARQFLAMRAARIVPVYWFFTLMAAGLIFVAPDLYRSNELSFRHVLLSLLFVPHGSSGPMIKQGWTLNYEVFFYVLFAAAMAISVRRRTILAVATLVIFAAAGQWMQIKQIHLGALQFYFQDIILEFAFGMLIATSFLRRRLDSLNASFAAALVVAGFLAMFILAPDQPENRALVYGLPAAFIVIGALAFEQRVPLRLRFLQNIGDASYSIYLIHIFPIAVLRAVWPVPMQGPTSLGLFMLLSIAMAIALGRVSYSQIERRSLKFLRKVIESRLS
jgi:exopolysaccharide production protein ExoZ